MSDLIVFNNVNIDTLTVTCAISDTNNIEFVPPVVYVAANVLIDAKL